MGDAANRPSSYGVTPGLLRTNVEKTRRSYPDLHWLVLIALASARRSEAAEPSVYARRAKELADLLRRILCTLSRPRRRQYADRTGVLSASCLSSPGWPESPTEPSIRRRICSVPQ